MEMSWYIDQIKFQLTGGVLETEIDDNGYEKIVNMALRELGKYYDATRFIEVDGASCIDLAPYPDISSVANVYRSSPMGSASSSTVATDPNQVSMWNMLNSGSGYYSSNWIYNIVNYSTLQSISNTLSTDLRFIQDRENKKLYVNLGSGNTTRLTIEYVPKLFSVDEVVSEYWVDILLRMSVAYAKQMLGRIRTRYTQTGALWTQDGETMLAEGKEELNALRTRLTEQAQYFYPID